MQNNVDRDRRRNFSPQVFTRRIPTPLCINPRPAPTRRWQLLSGETETRSPDSPRSSWRRWIRFTSNCDPPRGRKRCCQSPPPPPGLPLSPPRSIPRRYKGGPDARSIRKLDPQERLFVLRNSAIRNGRDDEKLRNIYSWYFEFLCC